MEGRRMNTADGTTDFSTEDLQSLQATVERFAKQAIAPNVPAWKEAGQFDRGLYKQAAELGLLGLGYPEHLGGTPAP
jgi:acyl-CoA dehydrogenase